MTVGSFESNEDGDGTENGKKKLLGLDWQINNCAGASRVFVHFLAAVDGNTRQQFSFSSLKFDTVL